MPSESFQIEGFPKDGRRWWIRAVDHVHTMHKSTATPSVEVLLSKIPEELDQQLLESRSRKGPDQVALSREILKQAASSAVCRVHVGTFPCLRIGSIFRDGVYNGRLPSIRRSFTLDLSEPQKNLQTFDSVSESLRPPWWNPKTNHRVLNFSEYPLFDNENRTYDFRTGKCAVYTSNSQALVVPCSEIFRAFYAPTSEFARALLSGPWKKRRNRIVAMEDTGVEHDGSWTVILRKEIADDYLLFAANLAVSECGVDAAIEVHATMMGDQTKRPASLHARIPFKATEFTVDVDCIPLVESKGGLTKYLALEVTGMTWPYPGIKIRKGRDNDGRTGAVRLNSSKPPPFEGRPGSNERRRGSSAPIPITSEEDPGDTGGIVRFKVSGLECSNPPIIDQLPKYLSYKYLGDPKPPQDDPKDLTSTGNPQPGAGGADQSSLDHSRTIDAPDRFLEIVKSFEIMLEKGLISDWRTISGKYVGFRDDLPVWLFPRIFFSDEGIPRASRWSWLEEIGAPRSALVCRITVGDADVYWVETEVLGGDGRRSVIVNAPSDCITSVIESLLRLGTQCRATWPKDNDGFCATIGASRVVTWRHAWASQSDKPSTSVDSSPGQTFSANRKLNIESMLAKIRAVAGL